MNRKRFLDRAPPRSGQGPLCLREFSCSGEEDPRKLPPDMVDRIKAMLARLHQAEVIEDMHVHSFLPASSVEGKPERGVGHHGEGKLAHDRFVSRRVCIGREFGGLLLKRRGLCRFAQITANNTFVSNR